MAESSLPDAAPGAPAKPVALVLPCALEGLVAKAQPLTAAELSVDHPAVRLNLRLREETAIQAVGETLGVALPAKACTIETDGRVTAIWQGPDEWLLVSADGEPEAMSGHVTAAVGAAPHSIVDVTERSLTLLLTGPRSAELLNSGCPLDLSDEAFPVGSGTRTVLGKAEIVLWRTSEHEYRLDVWRSFAPYVFGFLEEARRAFRA